MVVMGEQAVEQSAGRGLVLTSWLAVYSAAVVVIFGSLLKDAVNVLDHGGTLRIPAVLMLLGLLGESIALAGLWWWQRWGLPLIAVSVVVWLIGAGIADLPGLVISGRIVWLGAFVFALMPRWERFRA